MRILTMNIWGRGRDWDVRRRIIADGFRAAPPDLVALQEDVFTAEEDQASDLLGPDFEIVHQRDRLPNGRGIAIGSRWPIRRWQEVDLHVSARTIGSEVGALLAEIAAPEPIGTVAFVNHFPSWQTDREFERERQAVVVAGAIEAFAGDAVPVVVAGDLDADPDASSMRFWTGRQSLDGLSVSYRDAWESAHPGSEGPEAATFTPANPWLTVDWPFRRIDHILVRAANGGGPSLAIRGCERAFDAPVGGLHASDHFGIVAELDGLPSRPS